MKKYRLDLILGLLSILFVASCGIKPSELSSPSGDQSSDTYPRDYPSSQ